MDGGLVRYGLVGRWACLVERSTLGALHATSEKLHEQVDFMGDAGNKIGVGRRVEKPCEMKRQDTVIRTDS